MEGVERGFINLTKAAGFSSQTFNNLQKATDGTITSVELMTQANNAMLLGIFDSEDQMANMFDVAQRLGQSLGLDTVQAVESLVTGLGRQSKLMLDNLGIMVDTNKSYKDYAEANNIKMFNLLEKNLHALLLQNALGQVEENSKIFVHGHNSNRDLLGYNVTRDGSIIDFTTATTYVFEIAVNTSTIQTCYVGANGQQIF